MAVELYPAVSNALKKYVEAKGATGRDVGKV